MQDHDAVGEGEAEADAAAAAGGEGVEEALADLRRQAGAAVFEGQLEAVRLRLDPQLDRPLAARLPLRLRGVVQEIAQRPLEQLRIAA